MVQVNISTQHRVLASTYADVVNLMSHPDLDACMIVGESLPLWDDMDSTPTSVITVQGGIGSTCDTNTASPQGDPKAITSVDSTKSSTLAELFKSQKALRKDQA